MNDMLDRLHGVIEQQRRFVADASHELQTPLAAASVDLEVALAYPEATAWRQTAQDLLAENRRMERLVADLLFMARADDATVLPAPTPVDLQDVVLEEVARASGASACPIDTGGVQTAVVLGRREELARVVRNLLDNAARHARSTTSVALHSDDRTAELVVQDDGAGVAPEDRDRIFERFARGDDARDRPSGGTGLGLAIVREIVERHHGEISVEDARPGARFVISLPTG
jgi:signal transduction histidine kinase